MESNHMPFRARTVFETALIPDQLIFPLTLSFIDDMSEIKEKL